MFYKKSILFTVLFSFSLLQSKPKLTVVIIVDGFENYDFYKFKNNFSGGFKKLIDGGRYYTQAFHPHAYPSTSPGHATLSTGTLPSQHGIIGNKWFDESGSLVKSDTDITKKYLVFNREKKPVYKSPENMKVDCLSDQVMLHAKDASVWSVSLKSRSAIAMAGRLGKALWFDYKIGQFTSSRYYFKKLPIWVSNFNKKNKLLNQKKFAWRQLYSEDKYKDFINSGIYKFSKTPPMINTMQKKLQKYMPQNNQLILDMASVIAKNEKQKQHVVLWLGLSTLDKCNHAWGPNSKESVDTIYRLDQQVDEFMNQVKTLYGEDVLYVLSSDHGCAPIPEAMQEKGYKSAHRIKTYDFKKDFNQALEKKFKIKNLVLGHSASQVYFDQALLKKHSDIKDAILKYTKSLVQKIPGVDKVWLRDEITKAYLSPTSKLYLNHLFAGRNGDIFLQPTPYSELPTEDCATATHHSPYSYNRHVPLIMYMPGKIKAQKIEAQVSIEQLAPSMSEFLKIPRPSASVAKLLPGIK